MDQVFAVAWQYVVGLVPPEDLPMEAAQLLAVGLDSPALRDLAGRTRREETAEIEGLLRQAVGELGTAIPDEESAERCLLHYLAGQLAAGAKTPGEVAARVWQGLTAAQTGPERAFLLAVGDEYHVDFISDERPDAFQAWETALRAAAEQLSQTTSAEIGDLHERSRSAAG
ncbi:hypothetical protein OHA38_43955 (plasmid) [Streptomyces sp. NBC_01732]|uniref:hypothetical protein n=1 Tax=unclassified Streptomyces TaxID=2593676 RepID=UPI002F91A952|nr:hypothetical protein OHA38_43955 [Streptomyces sp. NBC_01732]